MTPGEVFYLASGYEERTDMQMQIYAWHAANIMNVHLKRKVSPKKLLGKEKRMTPLEREEQLAKLKQAMAEAERRGTNG